MRKISSWATANPSWARTLIILGHLILGMLALYLGRELRELEIILSDTFFYVPIVLFLAICLAYPSIRWSRGIGRRLIGFYILKTFHGLIFACSFTTMIYVFNQVNISLSRFATYATQPYKDGTIQKKSPASEIISALQNGEKRNLSRHEKKILKREFRKQLKIYSHEKRKNDQASSDKTLKIILVIVLAVGLLFLLAALACAIGCGGAEALAVIVAVAGLIGVIWITVYFIRKINRKEKAGMVGGEKSK